MLIHYRTVCRHGSIQLDYKDWQVWINDKWAIVADIWEWIIQAQQHEIDALPELQYGEYISSYKLPRQQRNLMSFTVNRGAGHPQNKMQRWASDNGEIGKLKNVYLSIVRLFAIGK